MGVYIQGLGSRSRVVVGHRVVVVVLLQVGGVPVSSCVVMCAWCGVGGICV